MRADLARLDRLASKGATILREVGCSIYDSRSARFASRRGSQRELEASDATALGRADLIGAGSPVRRLSHAAARPVSARRALAGICLAVFCERDCHLRRPPAANDYLGARVSPDTLPHSP